MLRVRERSRSWSVAMGAPQIMSLGGNFGQQVTARNAGWTLQFRIRGFPHLPDVREFWR